MQFFRAFAPLSSAALALAALTIVSCGTTTNPVTITAPNPVDSLQATSINANTVRVRWTASPTAGVAGYRIIVLNGTSEVTRVTPTGTIADIAGLTAGTVYTFRVQARTSDTVSTAKDIQWSPAGRVTLSNVNGPIYLYESASSLGSGLAFQGGTARNLSVRDIGQWDIGLDTKLDMAGAVSYDIGTPATLSYTTPGMTFKNTQMSTTVYKNIDSLNQVFDTQLFPSTFVAINRYTFTRDTRGFVIVVKTAEGNFAKIFVKAVNGVILRTAAGSTSNRFIEVEISYQPVANIPYAIAFNKTADNILLGEGSVVLSSTTKKASSQKD
jgi:hypothetical protein